MSTDTILEIQSSRSDDTLNLGKLLGSNCRGGEVFVLSSDLGGGKTTLSKGIGAGLDCQDLITSPTFTVSNIYNCKDNLEIHHFDFYRLAEAGVVGEEMQEVIGDKNIVTIIEWGNIVVDMLPKDKIIIELKPARESEQIRQIRITASQKYGYILKGIK